MPVDPNAGAIYILRRTRPWVRLASVAGLLAAALMGMFAVDVMLGGVTPNRVDPIALLPIYLLFCAAFLVPSFYLHNYASRILTFAAQGHNVQLEAALEAQRRFWTSAGILIIVCAVGVVAWMAVAVMGS